MRRQATTDLELLKKNHPFTWGDLIAIHELGRYSFVEYKARILSGPKSGALEDNTTFHLYIDGESLSMGFGSLDEAMLGAVAFSRLEINEARYMAMAAAKLMGIKP